MDAHVSLGQVVWYDDWDFAAGERELRRAIELEPNHARAHHWLAFDLGEVGRHEEAAAEIGRALALDPLSLIIHTNAGTLAYWARDFEGAIRRIDRELLAELALLAGRRFVSAYWKGLLLEGLGEPDAALAALERAVAERFDWVIALGVEPAFDGLRRDRRFTELVARVLAHSTPH